MSRTITIEGTKDKGIILCYREENIPLFGLHPKFSIEGQKAIEKCVKFGSTKIEIDVYDSPEEVS